MAAKKQQVSPDSKAEFTTNLKVGDLVMVLSGGNKKKGKQLKSQTGRIKRFLPKRNRAVIEGLNMIVRHKRATTPQEPAGKIEKEGSVHISNLMYYVEELKAPVRLKSKVLDNGRKVRGYTHPESKKFEQIDA